MANKSCKLIFPVVLTVVFAALLCALNVVTGPIIESNNQGAELEPLYAVMEDASGFTKLELATVADTVTQVWQENSGKGYVVRCATNKGYTGAFIELTMAVTSDGKISGINLDAYPETRDFGADYPATYIGQDSTLAGASLVSGVTFSSSAFKGAVADAFATLVDNDLIKAGVKEASQIIGEMVPTAAGFLRSPAGLGQYSEADGTAPVKKVFKAANGLGAAYWIESSGDFLAVVNNNGSVKVLDIDGNTVENKAVADAALKAAGSSIKSTAKTDLKKVTKMLPEGSVITEVPATDVFNSVSTVFKAGNLTAYVCRVYGFSNETMVIYVVLDENGAIWAVDANELIIEAEFFSGYQLEPKSYKEGFVGLTQNAGYEDAAVISGATISTNAVKVAIADAFEAASILGGKN